MMTGRTILAAAAAAFLLSAGTSAIAANDRIPIDQARPGAVVLVAGEVVDILDEDEFRLRDDTGAIRVYIGWQNTMPVNLGDQISVRGIVDDDWGPLLPEELYAQEIILEDGRSVMMRSNG